MYEGDAQQNGMPSLISEMERNLGIGASDGNTECWTDNWDAFLMFEAMSTQWNIGNGGAVGLRYESLPVLFEAFGTEQKSRAELIQLLRIMENEALQVING